MSKIRTIIIEDEPLAVKVLEDYIAQVPFLELVASFKDAILATDFLRDHDVDLIFLDIHLPKLKGMAFLKTLSSPPSVIITTAYHQYAVEGFNLNVTDYLLKPYEFERFIIAVNKVQTGRSERRDYKSTDLVKDYLFINVQKKKVKISFSEILFVESQREYVKLVTSRNIYLTKMPTHEIESLLPSHLFKRIHRSYIVAINKIDSYTTESAEVSGNFIPVGRGYRDVIEGL